MTSCHSKIALYHRWGTDNRSSKGEAILQTLLHFSGPDILKGSWLDIGCGNGEIAATIASHGHNILGIDPEPWSEWSPLETLYDNLSFQRTGYDCSFVSVESESADFVICNQVYEHVYDPSKLISEIHRILKPGGICYFAGPNRLFPIEPHVNLPFIHWLPRHLSTGLMRFFRVKGVIDAHSTVWWILVKWFMPFTIQNAVPWIIKNPILFGRKGILWRFLSDFPIGILKFLAPLSPGFVFILTKSSEQCTITTDLRVSEWDQRQAQYNINSRSPSSPEQQAKPT